MNLVATPWTVIAIFKVLDNTCLTESVEAFRHRGRLDEIPFTDIAGNVRIEIFHQVFPLGSHSWSAKPGSGSSDTAGSEVDEWPIPGAGAVVPDAEP